MKILFTCSSGGHLEELLQLKPIIKSNESYLLTEKNQVKFCSFLKVFTVNQINRKEKNFLNHLFRLFKKSNFIYKKLKPDLIISTGALVTVPICLIAKLHGIKIIYIESFARIYSPSLTGRIMYHFADIFIIQWKELKKYFPRAKYFGGIF